MSTLRLRTKDLAVEIGGHEVARGVNFGLGPGERLAILGRNGAGKTTLLHCLAGLRPPSTGHIELCGAPLKDLSPNQMARRRGLLLQHQLDAFPASVLETALIGRHPWLDRWSWETAADERLARQALHAVGLEDLAMREVHTLSGGERQRLAVATLITQGPQVALLDEPLSHLDLNHQIAILEIFSAHAREQGMTLVMVMHDPGLAARYADHALLMFGDGRVDIGPAKAMLTTERLSALYQHPLRELEFDGRRAFLPL